MRQFFKFFTASFLALCIFSVLAVIVFFAVIGSLASSSKPVMPSRAVLLIDLGQHFSEQSQDNILGKLSSGEQYNAPGLYELIRLIKYAKSDSAIKGIYLKCADNNNGLAASDELRDALLDFKSSRKFIYAYADVIPQRAYFVANIASHLYCNPKGGVEWRGLSLDYMFFKQTLEKLEIEPQIFYAGKFKSATEPFRADQMTDANRLQSSVFLGDIYNRFLMETAASRQTDTAQLHKMASELLVHAAPDALHYKLVDALKYDDEVKEELKQKLGLPTEDAINFIVPGKYARIVSFKKGKSSDKIAIIYAEGDIVDGKGAKGEIGGETYKNLIREARMDDDIKAIVVRVNSGGGSAMASEDMWRELEQAKKSKPVIMSFGNYAASGGYYMSCGADSIFCQPNTLTGSIGVFSMLPNLKKFYNNKLGITFDGVKTATHADMMTTSRPLSELEKQYFQSGVDSIYHNFLSRVSEGRKINIALVDSIAQGRVWTGTRAIELGLVDKLGGMQDALDCAARMAKLTSGYRLKEYPEPQSWFQNLINGYRTEAKAQALEEALGSDGNSLFNTLVKLKKMQGQAQARLPFTLSIQ